jgi:hypothetical protein
MNLVHLTLGCSQRGRNKMRKPGWWHFGSVGRLCVFGCRSGPAYASPVAYQSYTCPQLALEAQAISTRAATLSGAQDSQRTMVLQLRLLLSSSGQPPSL